jgi:hypothetical protein
MDDDGWMEYVPKEAPGAPYVYFDGRLLSGRYAYGATDGTDLTCRYPELPVLPGTSNMVRPYRSNLPIDARDNSRTQPQSTNNNTQWINPGKFQILCAGLDNQFGVENLGSGNEVVWKKFPDPNYYINAGPDRTVDEDNLADFGGGKVFGDSIP